MNNSLQKKVDSALKLLAAAEKMAAKVNQPLEICYSGGKDSDVILELAKMAGVNFRAIYKNTTIDPPGTIQHVLNNGVEIFRPKVSFRELLAKRGWPSRKLRFCCAHLKEYKILDYAVVGIRANESWKRAQRYKEPEQCREYTKTSKVRQYLPILNWSLDDVVEFIDARQIKCAPKYYDEDGHFCANRRLGCLCCPLMSKKQRIDNFVKYPNMVKMYINQGKIYRETHKKFLDDVYEWFCCYLFCDNLGQFYELFGDNLFGNKINCKNYLEDYFGIEL